MQTEKNLYYTTVLKNVTIICVTKYVQYEFVICRISINRIGYTIYYHNMLYSSCIATL